MELIMKMSFPFPVPASHLNAGRALGILKSILVLPCADSFWVISWGFYSVLLPTLSNCMHLSRSTRLCPGNKYYFSGLTQQIFISCSHKLEYFTWARQLSHPLRGDKDPGYLHLGTLLFHPVSSTVIAKIEERQRWVKPANKASDQKKDITSTHTSFWRTRAYCSNIPTRGLRNKVFDVPTEETM